MEKQIDRFRRQVEALFGGRPGPGVRYPEDLRTLAVEVALGAVNEGERLGTVAQLLGVGVGTLQRWVEAMPRQGVPLRAVEVVGEDETPRAEGETGGLVVVTAAGHRIEGLALAEVALLLESLG